MVQGDAQLVRAVRALRREGVAVEVLPCAWVPTATPERSAGWAEALRGALGPWLGRAAVGTDLIARVRARAPDVIVAFDPEITAPYALLARELAGGARFVVVVRERPSEPTHADARRGPRLDLAAALHRADLLVVPDVRHVAVLRREFAARGIAPRSIAAVPLGLPELDRFVVPDDLEAIHAGAEEQLVLGCALPEAGPSAEISLLRALAALAQRLPPHALRLEFAGACAGLSDLQAAARARDVAPYVAIHGAIAPDAWPGYYQGLHAVVLPTPHPGARVRALEAMACGVPVIAAAGVVDDLMRHGFNGLLVAAAERSRADARAHPTAASTALIPADRASARTSDAAWIDAIGEFAARPAGARVWMARQARRTAEAALERDVGAELLALVLGRRHVRASEAAVDDAA